MHTRTRSGINVPDPRLKRDGGGTMDMALGLGLGIGAFVVCCILICHCIRRRRRRMENIDVAAGSGLELGNVKMGGDEVSACSPTATKPKRKWFSWGGSQRTKNSATGSPASPRDSIAMLKKNHQTKHFTTNPLASPGP